MYICDFISETIFGYFNNKDCIQYWLNILLSNKKLYNIGYHVFDPSINGNFILCKLSSHPDENSKIIKNLIKHPKFNAHIETLSILRILCRNIFSYKCLKYLIKYTDIDPTCDEHLMLTVLFQALMHLKQIVERTIQVDQRTINSINEIKNVIKMILNDNRFDPFTLPFQYIPVSGFTPFNIFDIYANYPEFLEIIMRHYKVQKDPYEFLLHILRQLGTGKACKYLSLILVFMRMGKQMNVDIDNDDFANQINRDLIRIAFRRSVHSLY